MRHGDDSEQMKSRWDERAQQDAFFFIETHFWRGDIDEFFALGDERTRLLIDPVLARSAVDPGSATALEVGCGLGRFSRPLSRRFREVIGVDVSEEMVLRARELNPPSEYPNLTFLESDGVSLPTGSATVDFVFSYEVFQHMPTAEVMRSNLGEIGRALRPGGEALLQFWRRESRLLRFGVARATYSLLRATRAAVTRADPLITDPSFRGIGGLSLSTITGWCRTAGLEVVETWDDPTNYSHVFVRSRRS